MLAMKIPPGYELDFRLEEAVADQIHPKDTKN